MKIFFSAGEASGDQHTARLIQELAALKPGFSATGFGGPAMRNAGCRLLFELTDLAVMGFLRVLPLLSKFRQLVRQAESHFDTDPPDAVVVVDFPGFNWWIARAAKKRGIPVYYYLPPQLWGWAPWRIRRVRKWVDHVICALPFEYDWYRARGVKATWVGHPFFDQVAERSLSAAVQAEIRGGSETVVALLPGSRNHEIEHNWSVMLEVVRRVSAAVPGIRWVVGSYKDSQRIRCQELEQQAALPVKLNYVVARTSEVIESARCCLMVSGSISLELLARHRPGIVLYRASAIGRFFARFLMICRFITLTNLIADDELMPEFISSGPPEQDIRRMSSILEEWLTHPESLESRQRALSELADRVTIPGATRRFAELLLQELSATSESAKSLRRVA